MSRHAPASSNPQRTDMSSDEEDRHRRAQLHVKHRKLETASTQMQDSEYNGIFELAQQRGLSQEECPKLLPISQLTREFAHLRSNSDCRIAARKLQPSSSSSQKPSVSQDEHKNADEQAMLDTDATAEEVIKKHCAQARVLPYEVVAFAEKMSELKDIKFYSEQASQAVSQKELEQQLLAGRQVLPHLESSFERLLLAEAGTFRDPKTNQDRTYPHCAKQDKCVGKTVRFRHLPKQGVVFTSLMFPDEYALFLETGVTPTHARPCILCCREALVHWTIMCRADVMMGGPGASTPIQDKPWQMQQTQIRQLYYNSVNMPGGYQKNRVLLPSQNEPLVQPLVMLSRVHLFAYQKHGRWHIDQSAIEWQSPEQPEPRIGETHADF